MFSNTRNVKDSFLPYQPSGFTGSSLTRPVGVMLDYFNIPNKNWNKHKNSTFGERRLAFRNAFPNDVRLRDEDLYKGYRGRWAMRDWSSKKGGASVTSGPKASFSAASTD